MRALSFAAAWNAWWFRPDARHQVGLWRALLLSWFIALYAERYTRLDWLAARPYELYDPSFAALLLPLELPWSPLAQNILLGLAWTSLFAALAGVFTRASLIVFTVLTLYIEGIRFSFGYFGHADAIPCLMLAILCFAPGTADFSVDAWMRRRPQLPERPVWAMRMASVCLALLYLAAGISKLRYGAGAWISGETLREYLRLTNDQWQWFSADLAHPLYKSRPTELGRAIAAYPWATCLLANVTLALELSFPVLIFFRKTRITILAAAAILHLGISAAMQIDFTPYLFCYAIFVDWAGLFRAIRRR